MSVTSEQARAAVFEIFENQGNPLTRVSKGQQWIVQAADGTRALLKTAAKGSMIVKTMSTANDAPIIGFDADVTHVLAAVALPDERTVTAYLVPLDVAEAAYRRNNREWMAPGDHKPTTTWVLRFNSRTDKHFGHAMDIEWAEYVVGTHRLDAVSSDVSDASPRDVLEQCRSEIARAYEVEPEQVRISVDL